MPLSLPAFRRTIARSACLRSAVLAVAVGTLLLGTSACDWTSADATGADSLRVEVEEIRVRPQPLVTDTTAVFTAVPSTDSESLLYRWYLSGVAPVIISTADTVTWQTPPAENVADSSTFTHVVVVDDTLDDAPATPVEFDVTVQARTQQR